MGRLKEVWQRLFPLDVGDRVRVSQSKFIVYKFRGTTGVIKSLTETRKLAWVQLDKPVDDIPRISVFMEDLMRIKEKEVGRSVHKTRVQKEA